MNDLGVVSSHGATTDEISESHDFKSSEFSRFGRILSAQEKGWKWDSASETYFKPEAGGIEFFKFSTRRSLEDVKFYPGNWLNFKSYPIEMVSWYPDSLQRLKKAPFLTNAEKGEFIRFWKCLDIYQIISDKETRMYTPSYYWCNSLLRGPEFADWLKNQSAYSYRNLSINKFEKIYWEVNEFNQTPITKHSDLFPYQGLIKWVEECEDYKHSLEPVKETEPNLLGEFRYKVSEFLKEIPEIEIISDFEILNEFKPSVSFNEKEMKTQPHFRGNSVEFSEVMIGIRSVVPVYPAGTRDTVILTNESSNTVRWCERQLRHILEYMPESAITLNSSTCLNRLKIVKKFNERGRHILRDIKKCGLTFPILQFVDIIMDELEQYFPTSGLWDRFNVYRNRKIYGYFEDQSKHINPPRGYCLGMANHLVTFILSIIHRIIDERFYEEYPDARVRSLFGNDDSDIYIVSNDIENAVEYYMLLCYEIYNEFDINYNKKKTFTSRLGLFFEEYGHEVFNSKDHRLPIIGANAICLKDIRLAKIQLNSYLHSWRGNFHLLKEILSFISSHFEFEFYENESEYDYVYGGWIRGEQNSLSTCLNNIPYFLGYKKLSQIVRKVRKFENIKVLKKTIDIPKFYNTTILGNRLGLYGKNKDFCEFLQTKESMYAYYKDLYSRNRNPLIVINIINRIRNKILDIKHNSFQEVIDWIYNHYECQIPQEFIVERSFDGVWVNQSFFLNDDFKIANRTIKKIVSEVYKNEIQSYLIDETFKGASLTWSNIPLNFNQIHCDQDDEMQYCSLIDPIAKKYGIRQLWECFYRLGIAPKEILISKAEYKDPFWRLLEPICEHECSNIEELFPFEPLELDWKLKIKRQDPVLDTVSESEHSISLDSELNQINEEFREVSHMGFQEYIDYLENKPTVAQIDDQDSLNLVLNGQFPEKTCQNHRIKPNVYDLDRNPSCYLCQLETEFEMLVLEEPNPDGTCKMLHGTTDYHNIIKNIIYENADEDPDEDFYLDF